MYLLSFVEDKNQLKMPFWKLWFCFARKWSMESFCNLKTQNIHENFIVSNIIEPKVVSQCNTPNLFYKQLKISNQTLGRKNNKQPRLSILAEKKL